MQWHRWEPVSRDAVRAGAILAYGQPVEMVPKLDTVDLLLTIDSDLLDAAPGHLRFARDFRRAAESDADRSDEPDLCDRADADVDGGGGGSSVRRRAARSGADRAGTGSFGIRAGQPPADMPDWFGAVGRGPEGSARPEFRPCRARPSRPRCTPWSTR